MITKGKMKGAVNMDFHKRLQKMRQAAGYSSAQKFADALGLKYSTYAAYESRDRYPTYETLMKIADLLGVTTDQLLGHHAAESREKSIIRFLTSAGFEVSRIPNPTEAKHEIPGMSGFGIKKYILKDKSVHGLTFYVSYKELDWILEYWIKGHIKDLIIRELKDNRKEAIEDVIKKADETTTLKELREHIKEIDPNFFESETWYLTDLFVSLRL